MSNVCYYKNQYSVGTEVEDCGISQSFCFIQNQTIKCSMGTEVRDSAYIALFFYLVEE